jgi:hypothetical protein
MEKVAKAYIGEVVVHERMFDADIADDDIDLAMYNDIRSNTTIVRHPHVVDIYVFGQEYLIESEQYANLSDESIRIGIASTLVNFVVIENV